MPVPASIWMRRTEVQRRCSRHDQNEEPVSTRLTNITTVRDPKMHFLVTKGLLKHRWAPSRQWTASALISKRGQTLGLVEESGSGKFNYR